jgi:hypothetical protein
MNKLLSMLVAAVALGSFSGKALAQNQPTVIDSGEDSDSWKAFTKDSLTVLMDIHPVKLQGKWLQIEICFANNSDSTYHFTMEEASIECEKGRIPFLTEERFSKKVRHRKWWKNFGATSAVLVADVAVQVGTRIAFDTGKRWSFGRELGYGLTSMAIDLAANGAIWGISNTYGRTLSKLNQENVGYLHDITIKPRTVVQGHVITKAVKNAGEITVNLPINGQIFVFPWGILPDKYIIPTEHE